MSLENIRDPVAAWDQNQHSFLHGAYMQVLEHEGSWWAQFFRSAKYPFVNKTLGPFDDEATARAAAEGQWLRYCPRCAGYGSIKSGAGNSWGFIYCTLCLGWERRPFEDYPNNGVIQDAYIAWRLQNP